VRALLAALAAVVALGAQLGAAATTTVVMNENFFYNAASGTRIITVNLGDTVTWENRGEQYHDVTFDTQPWASGSVPAGGSWSRTFTIPGTFTYTCRLHEAEDMTGRVVVVGTAPTARVSIFVPYVAR
jgi:plastocyanin